MCYSSCLNGALSWCVGDSCSLPLEQQQSSSLQKCSFRQSPQSSWLSRGWFACFGAPNPKSSRRWLKLRGLNDAVLLKCCINSWVLSCFCVSTALSLGSSSPPVLHIKISACSLSGFHDVIMPPNPLRQSENGSPLLLQRTSPKSKGSMERSIHQPVWEWGGGCFVFSPWLHEQLKPVTYRSWKLHAENQLRLGKELRQHFCWLIKGLKVQRFRVNCQCATEESL